MVVDSSALVAMLLKEPGWKDLFTVFEAAPVTAISAATLVETGMVIAARQGPRGERKLDHLLAFAGTAIVPVDAAQAALARDAFRRFGKGRHPARLNFGDLFAYALARARAEPLLFVGDDFPRTDIAAALAPAGSG